MAYDARHVANYLLDRADEVGIPLTQISLQKTVFYSHGWYLVLRNEPLISDEVEAWTYGPVIRSLRDNFRVFGRRRISGKRAFFYDPVTDETTYVPHDIVVSDRVFLDRMLDFYGKMDPFVLVRMTHRTGSPWEGVKSDTTKANLGGLISNRDIARYFETLLRDRPLDEVSRLRPARNLW